MFSVPQFFADYIQTWEGGLSLNPKDAGNWYDPATGLSRQGRGTLIGSNRGVTGAALAEYRGSRVVTAADIRAITLDLAVQVGKKLFYDKPGFAALPWDQVIASAIDFGWGAGPAHGVMMIQQLVGVVQDGHFGPVSIAAYRAWIRKVGLVAAGHAMEVARDAYYDDVIRRIPDDEQFRNGWYNRSHYFAPVGAWWTRFAA